jgi:hypothetical protein
MRQAGRQQLWQSQVRIRTHCVFKVLQASEANPVPTDVLTGLATGKHMLLQGCLQLLLRACLLCRRLLGPQSCWCLAAGALWAVLFARRPSKQGCMWWPSLPQVRPATKNGLFFLGAEGSAC